MRTAAALLCALVVLPAASADHSAGHPVVPGGEAVDAAADALANATPGVGAPMPLPQADIECRHRLNMSGQDLFGFPVPSSVEEAHFTCSVGEIVVVTPDPAA